MHTETPRHGHRYLRAKQIYGSLLPISKSLFYAWIADGHFPKGEKLSPGVVVWREDVVLEWIRNQGEAALPPHLSLSCREARRCRGVVVNSARASGRWDELLDECIRRDMTIEDFAEERWEEGTNPYRYRTANRLKGYAFETMVREMSKARKRRWERR